MTRRDAIGAVIPILTASLQAQSSATGKVRGTVMAPIHMELFSDFQCPSCKAFHEQTLKPLIVDYVDKGKVYLVHREFPLPMHQYARDAAAFACAANRIGKYDQVADALFAKQESWAKDGKFAAAGSSVLSAGDAKKVQDLAQTADVKAEVEKEFQLAKGRIQSTPTSLLTHKGKSDPVSGYVSYAIFRRYVDELLTK